MAILSQERVFLCSWDHNYDMAQKTTRIVCDNDVLHGEPRLEGRRISVRQIADWVEAGNLSAKQ